MLPAQTADELRSKLANYKRTRCAAAKSMHRWLDALIADAEEQLRQFAPLDLGEAATAAPAPPRRGVRSTYPFDEHAPPQRPGLHGTRPPDATAN